MGTWLPPDFAHPVRVDLPTGHHMRPIRADDVDIDYPAVMGSQARLWGLFGAMWGWPPADMSHEEDRVDLARHEAEIAAHESFNYAILDADETRILGCVYIDPPAKDRGDAEVSWWVVDAEAGGPLELALERAIPSWLATEWPFSEPLYPGRDLSWEDYLAMPDAG